MAAWLDGDVFWKFLKRLLDIFDIAGKDLPPFMDGSMAVRLANGQFWKSLNFLCDEFASSGKDLPTFMSGSVLLG